MNRRPTWDEYFMQMAELVSTRSPDPSTKHGCVIVDKNKRIISTGYNGAIQGIDDSIVPLTRPEKYPFMIHSEDNAVIFARQPLEGSTVYITGIPCSVCLRRLLQLKVARIVYGDRSSACIDKSDWEASQKMIVASKVIFEPFVPWTNRA
jgi:dCMP deaminase